MRNHEVICMLNVTYRPGPDSDEPKTEKTGSTCHALPSDLFFCFRSQCFLCSSYSDSVVSGPGILLPFSLSGAVPCGPRG